MKATNENTKGILMRILLFIAIPMVIYLTNDIPTRSAGKESLSILNLLAFFLMASLFSLNRYSMLNGLSNSFMIKIHKFIGYTIVVVLLLHPFFIILPRFFEAGIDPLDALILILSNYQNGGTAFGIIAWLLLLLIGLTAYFRKYFSYKNWRIFHGILSLIFMLLASGHMLLIGRHSDRIMSLYIILLTAYLCFGLLKNYFSKQDLKAQKNHE